MSEQPDPASAAIAKLTHHMTQVQQHPSLPLDVSLFDAVEPLAASNSLDSTTAYELLGHLTRLLSCLQQDPTPVIQLVTKVGDPFDFDAIRSLEPPIDFTGALVLAATPYHALALHTLEKAARDLRHAEYIASYPNAITRLIYLWLATDDIGTAERASSVLFQLLKVDQDPADVMGIESAPDSISNSNPHTAADVPTSGTSASYGTGFVWKRVFGDKDIYKLFFCLCGAKSATHGIPDLTRAQKTVAQARLMSWIPKVGALSWEAITRSHHPQIEQDYGLKSHGLLDFIALHIVDYDGDILMHISLMEFFSDLLKTCSQPSKHTASHHASNALEYLKSRGLHDRTLSYFLNPSAHESFEISYLYGPAANYLATYASNYPTDFEASDFKTATLRRLMNVFSSIKPAQWVHGESPRHDLHILASLPRTTLLADSTAIWVSTPLSLVPGSRSTNSDALHTLATIFHGPEDPTKDLTFPAPASPSRSSATFPERLEAERSAARTLTALFTQHNPSFWLDLVQLAETIALKDTALASLNFINALATASWSTTSSSAIPSDFPFTGLSLLLRPGNPVLPYLLRPAPSFSNLVGGRGDAENAAYQVAMRKFDVLRTVLRRLESSAAEEVPGRDGLLEMMRVRAAEGVWGRGGDVGGRIDTLEL
ncbi:hypothetical protein SLS56_001152 [Neofusicoccum ribis]|uniref:Uncharacterized protein n=1 Tax=Neofusicoccum ribis TaxID=45134 RepID=A0ABR3TAP5_9PEZI